MGMDAAEEEISERHRNDKAATHHHIRVNTVMLRHVVRHLRLNEVHGREVYRENRKAVLRDGLNWSEKSVPKMAIEQTSPPHRSRR